MFSRRPSPAVGHRHVVDQPGLSLAKGPAILIGLGLTAAGLLGLLKNATFTPLGDFPDGAPGGTEIAGIEINGWTCWITILAGALLLFGAAAHLGAKLMSLVVGIGLLCVAFIGVAQGDVLGLAASNWLTQLLWGLVGGVLVLNAFAPRRRKTREVLFPGAVGSAGTAAAGREPEAAPARFADASPGDRDLTRDDTTAVRDRDPDVDAGRGDGRDRTVADAVMQERPAANPPPPDAPPPGPDGPRRIS